MEHTLLDERGLPLDFKGELPALARRHKSAAIGGRRWEVIDQEDGQPLMKVPAGQLEAAAEIYECLRRLGQLNRRRV